MTHSQVDLRLADALAQGGSKAAKQIAERRWIVAGRHRNYVVLVHADNSITCTCLAGQHGTLCWHVISVALNMMETAA